MPVIADLDEPPAKCCKFCDESTHSVDEPESWRLTLDQDLIDTLKGSFPNWFKTNNPAASSSPSSSSSSSSSSSTSSSSSSTSSSIQSDSSSSKILLPITDSSCKNLLAQISTADQLYKQIIFEETFDGMAEGDHLCNPSTSSIFESSDGGSPISYDFRPSPPKAIVDSSPLQPAMDKNKESLKVKLMVRRPITQLVEQGIIPPLKTSPAIHEQCKLLERAKTGDLLKAKIQQRPNREELERRHILEYDESHVDPSLAEKQRMLKKARLADQLNSQISHRPGPLELIKKNILHTEKPIERIVKEGLVSFKATSEGLLTRPQQPHSYITFEDDSQSSESDTRNTPPRQNVLEAAAASAGIVTVAVTIPTNDGQVVVTSAPILETKFHPTALLTHPLPQLQHLQQVIVPPPPPPPPPTLISTGADNITHISSTSHPIIQVKQDTSNLFAELCQSVAGPSSSPGFLPLISSPASLGSSASTLSPLSSISSPPQSLTPRPTVQSPVLQLQQLQPQLQQHQTQKSDAPGKDKNRKKSKSKPITKARTIKFHEYKGPPSSVSAAQKMMNTTTSSADADQSEETSYQLMLEQQNCLLKFLENLNKNQSILTNNSTKNNTNSTTSTVSSSISESNSVNSNQNIQQNQIIHQPNTPHPPPMPSPGPLSVSSSVAPPSPAPSSCYADSICSTTTNSSGAITDISKLEKMKVSDLKLQLKKRNLPVSGPKPQLIERLKPYLPLEPISVAALSSTASSSGEMMTICGISGETCDASDTVMIVNSPRSSMSPESNHPHESMDIGQQIDSPYSSGLVNNNMMITIDNTTTNNDLVREQQRKIDELQRQLEKSQQELQQIKQIKQQIVVVEQQPKQVKQKSIQQQPPPSSPAPTIPINQKMVVKQQLEAKIQKQQAKAQALAQAQSEAQLLLNTAKGNNNSKPAPPLIIPSKDEPKSSTATIITTTAKQIPMATINKPQQQQHQNLSFVWGENQTIYLVGLPHHNNDGKKLFNGYQQRTLSLPSMVFPVSAMPTGSSVLSQSTTTPQQFIETENVFQHLKSQPPALIIKREPPLIQQTSERQQTISTTNDIQVNTKQPPPLYREVIKQEPKQLQQELITKIKEEPIDKKNLKSENLTDVLDILIKNGELSESALNTPTTPSGNTTLISSSDGVIFSTNKNHQQHNDIMDLSNNDETPESAFQNTLLLNTPLNIDNIDISSPLQTDCHIDVDESKAFDVFLNQKNMQYHSDCTNNVGDDDQDLLNLHIEHKNKNSSNEINHFDDLELLELMSQQLDMDIGEETCQNFPSMVIDNNSALNSNTNSTSQQQQQQQHKNALNTRRDMNPSLQPSINELIQQQQHTSNNNNNFHHNLLTNDSDVNSVSGGIGDTSNNGSNGFDSSHFNLNPNCNNNFNSTPMDVCDDFDNSLASLGFGTNFSPDSNINTPPHPFSSGLSNNSNDGFGDVGGANTMLLSGGSGQQQLYHNNGGINQMTTSGSGCCGNSSSNDSFSTHLPISQDHILDLFNIDDFKMTSWGGVDYAV